jgi:hypothetical protein
MKLMTKAEVMSISAYWQGRAEETRTMAEHCLNAEIRELIYKISDDYEVLALRLEQLECPLFGQFGT